MATIQWEDRHFIKRVEAPFVPIPRKVLQDLHKSLSRRLDKERYRLKKLYDPEARAEKMSKIHRLKIIRDEIKLLKSQL
jgi:hypothetical protein